MRKTLLFVFFLSLLYPCLPAAAQHDSLSAFESVIADRIAGAAALRAQYRLREAVSEYESLLPLVEESARVDEIRCRISEIRRSVVMMDLCHAPEVVAKREFPLKDFVLFYPFKNGSWRPLPNAFDTDGGDAVVQAIYAPRGVTDLYYSAREASGCRNIYHSVDRDSLWTVPELPGEHLMSAGNEIYPMLSRDGKTLYFASDGLFGIGGYDLYKSAWDETSQSWGAPENLGYPYNSPGDDFLFIESEDGKYAIFASNRECSRDSVCLYVLDAATLGRETRVKDVSELQALLLLNPTTDLKRMDNDSMVDRGRSSTDGTKAYREQMNLVRSIKDQIYRNEKAMDDLKMAAASDTTLVVADSLAALETALSGLRAALDVENAKVRQIESEFLRSGVVSSAEEKSSDREVVGAGSAYTFTKHSYGTRLKAVVAVADTASDAFSTGGTGNIERSMPEGTFWQIRFMTGLYHASVEDLRGLTPVFERLTPDLQYAYYAGLFHSRQGALAALNRVRSLGFRDARIVLIRDGKEVEEEKSIAGQ